MKNKKEAVYSQCFCFSSGEVGKEMARAAEDDSRVYELLTACWLQLVYNTGMCDLGRCWTAGKATGLAYSLRAEKPSSTYNPYPKRGQLFILFNCQGSSVSGYKEACGGV